MNFIKCALLKEKCSFHLHFFAEAVGFYKYSYIIHWKRSAFTNYVRKKGDKMNVK